MIEEVDLVDEVLLPEAVASTVVFDVTDVEGWLLLLLLLVGIEHSVLDFDFDVGIVDELVFFLLL